MGHAASHNSSSKKWVTASVFLAANPSFDLAVAEPTQT